MRFFVLLLAVMPFWLTSLSGCRHAAHFTAALAETAADGERLNQVTKSPYRMHLEVSTLCLPPLAERENPDPHKDFYCHVFVNDAGLETMRTGKGKYPVGSVVVKQKFSNEEATVTELFTMMRKMEEGYDPENGDWEYSTIDRSAKKVLSRGRTESCINCHKAYEETDYVTREYLKIS